MRKMTYCKGRVNELRHSFCINNSHAALFSLGGQRVILKSDEPIFINNGDDVIIIGSYKRNVFCGVAYFNSSKEVSIIPLLVIPIALFAMVFFIVGLATLMMVIGFFFLTASLFIFYWAWRHYQANIMLKKCISQ